MNMGKLGEGVDGALSLKSVSLYKYSKIVKVCFNKSECSISVDLTDDYF